MFTLLSNQTSILQVIKQYSSEDRELASKNLQAIVISLNLEAGILLTNRRQHGVLLPLEENAQLPISKTSLLSITLNQLLLNQNNLVSAINTLCLTEAMIVKNCFCNCLEFIDDELLSLNNLEAIHTELQEKKPTIEKNNVSPIRLTDIKQRLAQAAEDSEHKQIQIKNRLNKLLSPPLSNQFTIKSKQA